MENLVASISTDFEIVGAAIGEVKTRFGLIDRKLGELSFKFIRFNQHNKRIIDINNT